MRAESNYIKYRGIAAALRAKILSGEFKPGTRLPTREALIRQFDTTSVTIQKAFDLLADQGWIRAAGRRGTFVSEKLPNRCYALAFPWPRQIDTSQFYRALWQQAEQLTTPQRQITCFYEIGSRTDTEDYLRLADLVRSHRLAGVIFANNPFDVEGLPVLEEPGVARVTIIAPKAPLPVPFVGPDVAAFCGKALDVLAAAGRRRVAVITLAQVEESGPWLAKLFEMAAARGLQIQRAWVQAAPLMAPQWARHAAEVLFQAGTTARPDALLITDDNLVPEATAGVRAAGVRVPEDVRAIVHTNFPYPTPAAVPVTRVGFDISHLLELCIERIDQQCRGEQPPMHTVLPPLSEAEYRQRGAESNEARAQVSALETSHQSRDRSSNSHDGDGGRRLAVRCTAFTRSGPLQAGPLQAGPLQAGPLQTGPLQAGPLQTGPLQAGPPKGGTPNSFPTSFRP